MKTTRTVYDLMNGFVTTYLPELPRVMSRLKLNIEKSEFARLREEYCEVAGKLDEFVTFAGSKAIIDSDCFGELPVNLSDELWRRTLRIKRTTFLSNYLQVREVLELPKSKVGSILEIGPGKGIFQSLIKIFPYKLTTFDIIKENGPDVVGNVLNLPFKEKAFDMLVCFQVLEHLPYLHFTKILKALSDTARHYVYLSIPYRLNSVCIKVQLNFVSRYLARMRGSTEVFLPFSLPIGDIDEQKMMQRKDRHNPHYWEAGTKSFPIKRIIEDICSSDLKVTKQFHNLYYPYHYFLLLRVTS